VLHSLLLESMASSEGAPASSKGASEVDATSMRSSKNPSSDPTPTSPTRPAVAPSSLESSKVQVQPFCGLPLNPINLNKAGLHHSSQVAQLNQKLNCSVRPLDFFPRHRKFWKGLYAFTDVCTIMWNMYIRMQTVPSIMCIQMLLQQKEQTQKPTTITNP